MRYVALVYYDEATMNAMPQEQWNALNHECVDCVESMRASGHFVAGQALHPVETATTLRVRDGKVSATDGPFAETREQLAGFYLIEARDLNEAMRVAGRMPPARHGSIEIRPVRDLPPPPDRAPAGTA